VSVASSSAQSPGCFFRTVHQKFAHPGFYVTPPCQDKVMNLELREVYVMKNRTTIDSWRQMISIHRLPSRHPLVGRYPRPTGIRCKRS
jgi:hypothetical protein